jgi:hypothetical protein
MDLSNVTKATLAELADGTSAINGIGAHRSKPLQIALADVSGVLYVSRALGKTWAPNGITVGGAKLPAVSVGGLAPSEPEPAATGVATQVSLVSTGTYSQSDGTYVFSQIDSSTPSVGGTGTGLHITGVIASGALVSVTAITEGGEGYVVGEQSKVRVTLGGEFGESGTSSLISIDQIDNVVVEAPAGSVGEVLTVNIDFAGAILDTSVTQYNTTSDGAGTGLTVEVTTDGSAVTSVTVVAAGADYVAGDSVVLVGAMPGLLSPPAFSVGTATV